MLTIVKSSIQEWMVKYILFTSKITIKEQNEKHN